MLTALLVALAAALSGCSITPQPEPPLIDRTKMQLVSDGMSVTLTGLADAVVAPPEMSATVTVIGLDSPVDEMVLTVAPDGSFATGPFPLATMTTPEVRVFATADDGTRSEVLDLVGAPDGSVSDAPRPLLDCLRVPETLLLGEVAAEDIVVGQARIDNDCADIVIIEFVTSRRLDEFFPTLGMTGMIATVRAGSSRNIAVTFEPGTDAELGPHSDLVYLQITGMAGEGGRRIFEARGEVVP